MTTIPANRPVRTAAYSSTNDRAIPAWGEISWGPIMMGAVCAIGLQFIFTVLGIALGATAGEISDGVDASSARTVGIAAGLWWLITGTIALAVGGFVVGRLSGLPNSLALKLEAAAMWSVVALFGFLLIWSGTGMISEAASPIGAIAASSQQQSFTGTMDDRGLSSAAMGATDNVSAEDARNATQTASWWSVIGLVVGLGASIGGAAGGATHRTADND